MSLPTEMKAVVIHGPRDIRVDTKPVPKIEKPNDAIVKVIVAGICGSELHPYRGHQKMKYGHTMVCLISSPVQHRNTAQTHQVDLPGINFMGTPKLYLVDEQQWI